MHDERGRLVETVNTMSVGGDGKLYFQAPSTASPAIASTAIVSNAEIQTIFDACFHAVDPSAVGDRGCCPLRGSE